MSESDTRAREPGVEFEGESVHSMEGVLPGLTLDMPVGYTRGTHLALAVEVRVRHVTFAEDRRGELVRRHSFALEEIRVTDAFDPNDRPDNVGGSMSGSNILELRHSFPDGPIAEDQRGPCWFDSQDLVLEHAGSCEICEDRIEILPETEPETESETGEAMDVMEAMAMVMDEAMDVAEANGTEVNGTVNGVVTVRATTANRTGTFVGF